MKEIKLTQEQITIVDDDDFEELNQFKWYALKSRGKFYATRRDHGRGQKKIYMHRTILNALANIQVDHINGNPLDNRRVNLRLATGQQNQSNKQHPQKNNKLGVKGVHWHEKGKKYHAKIQHNRKTTHLGHFELLADADRAYRDAEVKYFGNFARQVAN